MVKRTDCQRFSFFVASALLGCVRPLPSQAQARTCVPVEQAALPASFDAHALAGTYRLTIVSTRGGPSGQVVQGSLKLWAPDTSTQRAWTLDQQPHPTLTYPLIGTLELEVGRVGGVPDGSLTSRDPRRPGVLARYFRDEQGTGTAPRLAFEVGSEGNRRDVVRFDGPTNTLEVTGIDARGFRGRWDVSLGYTDYEAGGTSVPCGSGRAGRLELGGLITAC